MTDVVHDRAALAAARSAARGQVALVPTMGALHAGHAALVDAARAAADTVIVSVFVNPAQFGPGEDYEAYPRTLEADVELCAQHGADLVWAPAVADVYPAGAPQVRPDPGPLGAILEGGSRPTHFAGMLTVVAKLFGLTRPDVAFFGQKDYQQLTLITRMVLDLELGIDIVGVPTVREPDGLALSSRNRYLSATERQQALALSRALFAGAAVEDQGADAVQRAASAVLDGAPGVELDYLALRAADLGLVRGGASRLLVAARVGPARLIDNVAVHLPDNEESDDAARD